MSEWYEIKKQDSIEISTIERLLLDYIEDRFGVGLVGILIGYMKSLKGKP